MGSRASFWIGNPCDPEREWLGCIAWDGYPSGLPELVGVENEEGFRLAVEKLKGRDDFSRPENGWPFPWKDVFETGWTYAFFQGRLYGCRYREPFQPFAQAKKGEDVWFLPDDPLHWSIPTPSWYNPMQPDSIIVITGLSDGSLHSADRLGEVPELSEPRQPTKKMKGAQ